MYTYLLFGCVLPVSTLLHQLCEAELCINLSCTFADNVLYIIW